MAFQQAMQGIIVSLENGAWIKAWTNFEAKNATMTESKQYKNFCNDQFDEILMSNSSLVQNMFYWNNSQILLFAFQVYV